MISDAKKSSTLPLKLRRTKFNFGTLKLDKELESKSLKTCVLNKDSDVSGHKQSEVMEKILTCTSELVTDEDIENRNELLPMLVYEKIVDQRLI